MERSKILEFLISNNLGFLVDGLETLEEFLSEPVLDDLIKRGFFNPPAGNGRNRRGESHLERVTRYSTNVRGLVSSFEGEGLTVEQYLKAALKQPQLFYSSPGTVEAKVRFLFSVFNLGMLRPTGSSLNNLGDNELFWEWLEKYPISLTIGLSNLISRAYVSAIKGNVSPNLFAIPKAKVVKVLGAKSDITQPVSNTYGLKTENSVSEIDRIIESVLNENPDVVPPTHFDPNKPGRHGRNFEERVAHRVARSTIRTPLMKDTLVVLRKAQAKTR